MEPKTKKQRSLYIPYAGPVLLEFPLLNKGSAGDAANLLI